MYLKHTVPMRLKVCAMKYFRLDEFHVTRRHKNNVLILMLDGILHFFEEGKQFSLRAGEYYIQRAGLLQEGLNVHGIPNTDPPAVYYYLEFDGGEFADDEGGIPLFGSFERTDVQPFIDACDAAAHTPHSYDPFLMTSYLYRIFSVLYANTEEGERVSGLLHMVRRYIDSEYSSISNLGTIAKKFGYHSDYLSKLFLEKYGVTLFGYLKNVRMEHAMWLLQNSLLATTQIALLVGYENYSSFYRNFVSVYGVPPTHIQHHGQKTIAPTIKKEQ